MCISVRCQMSFQDTKLVSRTARKETSIIFPRKVGKGIVGEHYSLFLQWIKYTNLEHLRPLIHGSSADLKTLLWVGVFFNVCVWEQFHWVFFSIISSCSLCSLTRCMAAPVRCFLNTKCHSLSTPNDPNWLSFLAALQALHTMLISGKHLKTFANLSCHLHSLKQI